MMATSISQVDGNPHVYFANFAGLKGGVNPVQTPQTGVRIAVPATVKGKAFFLPFMGDVQGNRRRIERRLCVLPASSNFQRCSLLVSAYASELGDPYQPQPIGHYLAPGVPMPCLLHLPSGKLEAHPFIHSQVQCVLSREDHGQTNIRVQAQAKD